eukprot:gnl/MRDRNA2_/MRDRNA2_107512_c0_seq1.p1 gnl/MRDRNA2_/MRDRNA2_107512_c0~~gnl/MRDRNA2_/MRDRNA2_107512_c0_seq1.p1  ORF type:complete len:535 (-),score=121.51 gnl/MRDRNA2_/MRDRNA2_107512_c0_seq1:211-1815(-)
MMSSRIASLIGTSTVLLVAVATVLFVTQALQGHASYQETPMRFGSFWNQKDESSVPSAAKILYAQLSSSLPDAQQVALHHSLGQVYQDSGNYEEAIKHFLLARNKAAQLDNSEQIVMIQASLGIMYAAAGRLQEANRELQSAFLVIDRRSIIAFAIIRALANTRRDLGRLEEAFVLYEEALRLQDQEAYVNKVLPRENLAGLLSDMGLAYLSKGQYDVAMLYYQQALDKIAASSTSLPTSGSPAIELAEIYTNIGQLKQETGSLEQAGEYYHKALRVQYRAMRQNHPRIVETLIHLARLQRDSGASEDSILAALAKAENLLNGRENQREFARILMLKADILRKKELLADAEAAALRALQIEEGLGSQGTPELAIILNILGQTLHDQDRYGDAEKQYRRALAMNMETVGRNHPETSLTYNNLGYLYQDTGDNVAAERCYRKSAEIQKIVYAHDTLDMAATYNNMATILVGQGRLSEAKELLMQAAHIAGSAELPAVSPERDTYKNNLEDVEHLLARSIKSEPVVIQKARPLTQMV